MDDIDFQDLDEDCLELIRQHREAGAPMYYCDEDTPEGEIKCLMPDGTIKTVTVFEEMN